MKISYIIKNGHVIDPLRQIDSVQDIYIENAWIVPTPNDGAVCDESHVIDASGCLVVPGLVDYHVHCFHGGSGTAVYPDTMLSTGVTAAVDAGTAGTSTLESFCNGEVTHAAIKLKAFLTPYAGGQLDIGLNEDFNPSTWNYGHIARLVERYRSILLGFKIRLQYGIVPEKFAQEYMRGIIDLADNMGNRFDLPLRICVHTTDCPLAAGELAAMLRPGDVFTHCYQGGRNNIILSDGSVDPTVTDARNRGVVFDCCNGKNNYSIDVCRAALEQGFYPDVISSDITIDKFNLAPYTKSLSVLASKYLSLGMKLPEVIRACTETPAQLMGMKGKIGTLAPGAYADVAIFNYAHDIPVHHLDANGTAFIGNDLLIPQMTFLNGDPVYSYAGFNV